MNLYRIQSAKRYCGCSCKWGENIDYTEWIFVLHLVRCRHEFHTASILCITMRRPDFSLSKNIAHISTSIVSLSLVETLIDLQDDYKIRIAWANLFWNQFAFQSQNVQIWSWETLLAFQLIYIEPFSIPNESKFSWHVVVAIHLDQDFDSNCFLRSRKTIVPGTLSKYLNTTKCSIQNRV